MDSRPAHPFSLLDQALRDGLDCKEAFESEGCGSYSFLLHGEYSRFQSESPSSRLCSLLLLFLEKCQDSYVEHQLGTTEELGFRPVRDLDVTLTYRATVEGWVETQRSFRSFENIGWDGPTMALRLDLAQTSCLINKVLFWHIAVPLCILSVIVLLYSSRGKSF